MSQAKKGASLFGGFEDFGYISTDPDPAKTDPYIKAEPIPSRYLGTNFKAGHLKPKADGAAAFLTLASSTQTKDGAADVYLNPGSLERKAASEAKKKNIDPNRDFKYVSFPKKAPCSGSYVGTFYQQPLPHERSTKSQSAAPR